MTEGVRRASEGVRASDPGADDPSAGDERAVLVLEPAFRADAARQFDRALGDDGRRSVLAVLYRHDVRASTTALRDRCDRIDSAAAVAVGPVAGTGRERDGLPVHEVSDPTDLTGVGIAVGEWLRARDGDERPVVCLDSLSTLLQYADLERAFRFLHALVAQVRAADARAYASVDPGAHDETTHSTLATLFDGVRSAEGATAAAPGEMSAADTAVADGGGPEGAGGSASGPE